MLDNMLAEKYEISNEDFDLLIIDGVSLKMKWEEIRRMRKENILLPVLLVTRKQDLSLAEKHLWKDVDELIIEPIERVELIARIEVLLRLRRQALELKEHAEMLEIELGTLLTSMGESVIVINPSFEIKYVNRKTATILESKGIENVVGAKCFNVFHNRNEPIDGCPCVRAMKTKQVERAEVQMDLTGGEYAIIATPVFRRGIIEKVIHLAVDMTEVNTYRRKIEELNKFLNIINQINSLIISEKNIDILINKVASKLSEFYKSVYIAITTGGALKFYPASLDDAECLKKAMAEKIVVYLESRLHIDSCRYAGSHSCYYSMAIPMCTDSIVKGGILIQSERPFSIEERGMLATLANDLAFGISARENEVLKDDALAQIRENMDHFALLVDNIRNPLAAAQGYLEFYVSDEYVKEKIWIQHERIVELVRKLENVWRSSEELMKGMKRSIG
ncbi:MAG: PAS domain-containing protein [Methanomassiliicoccales archaeon]|nr:PAS domain-containing protein [Methanomassiliicoccales archaeon]